MSASLSSVIRQDFMKSDDMKKRDAAELRWSRAFGEKLLKAHEECKTRGISWSQYCRDEDLDRQYSYSYMLLARLYPTDDSLMGQHCAMRTAVKRMQKVNKLNNVVTPTRRKRIGRKTAKQRLLDAQKLAKLRDYGEELLKEREKLCVPWTTHCARRGYNYQETRLLMQLATRYPTKQSLKRQHCAYKGAVLFSRKLDKILAAKT